MHHSQNQSLTTASIGGGVDTANNIQRPPYFENLGNDFIQSLMQQTQHTEDSAPALPTLIGNASNHQILQALPLVQAGGLDYIVNERQWGVTEFIKLMPQLPEQVMLRLDALGAPLFQDRLHQAIDRFFPQGQVLG